jgi:hypothetical protein
VAKLFNRAGGWIATTFGMTFGGMEWKKTENNLASLRLEFRDPGDDSRWVRVFLVRLPYQYSQRLDGCIDLLHALRTDRNFLWLLRPRKADPSWAEPKPDQIFPRELLPSAETALRAMLRLLDKKEGYPADNWPEAEQVIAAEFKLTYLGEMLQQVAEALESQPGRVEEFGDTAPTL